MTDSSSVDPIAPVKPPAILSLIGDTPLVEITRMDTGPCQLFLKLENQNPTGSIKDRIALSMIEAAERGRKVGTRGYDHRGDRWKHRSRPGVDRGRERLSPHPGHPRQDVAGENRARARARRRGADGALRRHPRTSGILPGRCGQAGNRDSRRVLRQSVWQSGQSART